MNSHTKKLNNCRPSQRHTKTGNQKKISCFFALIFGIFKNCQYCAVQRGIRKKSSHPFGKSASCPWRAAKRKSVLFIWQFSIFGSVGNEREMKKFLKIPAYSGLCGFVGNEGNFLQINVHFAFRWFVGIRGRNVSAALAESPPCPSRVSENSMRYFRRNATNQPPIAG